MARARTSFKQADATRALRAAVAAGLRPSGYKIDLTGAIEVLFSDGNGDAPTNPLDRILQR